MAMKDAIPRFSGQRKKAKARQTARPSIYRERENRVALRQAISPPRALPSCRLRPFRQTNERCRRILHANHNAFSQLAPPG